MNKMMRMFLVGTTVFSLVAHVNAMEIEDKTIVLTSNTNDNTIVLAPQDTIIDIPVAEMDQAEAIQEKSKQKKGRSRLAIMAGLTGTAVVTAIAADCYFNDGKLTKQYIINPAQKHIATPVKNAAAYVWKNLPTFTNWFGKAKKVAETVTETAGAITETVEAIAAKAVEAVEEAPQSQSWFSYLTKPAYDYVAKPVGDVVYNYAAKPAYDYAAQPVYDYATKPAYDYVAKPAYDYAAKPAYDYVAQPVGTAVYNNAITPLYNFGSKLVSKAVEAATEEATQELVTQLTDAVVPALTAEGVETALSTLAL